MEEIQFVKMNPNKNTTILVLNECPRGNYRSIAQKLMSLESVYAEQVGFVESPTNPKADYRLEMMGGEFCANALASLSAYMAYKQSLEVGQKKKFDFESSGSDVLVETETQKLNKSFRTKLVMPLPVSITEKECSFNGQVIKVGIVVYEDACQGLIQIDEGSEQSALIAKHVLHEVLDNCYATKGVTLFSKNPYQIKPLIYVMDTNTEIWENSCGIASASLALYISHRGKMNVSMRLKQPSGEFIYATVDYKKERITKVTIEQDILLSAKGTAFL